MLNLDGSVVVKKAKPTSMTDNDANGPEPASAGAAPKAEKKKVG